MGSIPSLSESNPGVKAVFEFNIIVAPEDMETVTKGGIIITHDTKEKGDTAAMRGRLIDFSPLAFNYDTWPEGAKRPEAGDVVLYARYAGVLFDGLDGKKYRAMKDKDLVLAFETGPEGQ